jgi:hypothetical protein
MGISDDAYAEQLDKLRAEVRQIHATNISSGSSAKASAPLKMKNEDLDREACRVSISTLIDMWVLRWQDKWVTEDEIRDADDFWRIAFVRLENVNKIEKHTLGDSYDKVYRIIE